MIAAGGEYVPPFNPTEVPDGLFHPVKVYPLRVGKGSVNGLPKLKFALVGETVPLFAA